MHRDEWSSAAHAGLPFMGPYGTDALAELFAGVDLPVGARVVDLGCGTGALLGWLAARWAIEGLGVDLRPGTAPAAGVTMLRGDAEAVDLPAGAFDLACSLGAVTALDRLAELARMGGLVLHGDGYWRRPPSDAYLTALGAARDELRDRPGGLAAGAAHGLRLVRSRESTEEEWDRYEDAWADNGERYAAAHPGEDGVGEFLTWIRAGRRRYGELGGRETLGFALTLWRGA